MTLDSQIEAVLFFKGEPVSLPKLCDILKTDQSKIEEALEILAKKLEGRGLVLMRKEGEVALGTAPAFSSFIEGLSRDELERDLGKAGLETLSVILYRGPVARREIDYIRGVNSNFILRNLLVRGLVEKVPSPKDQRSFLYKPTFEVLQFMGLTKIQDLPEYESIRKSIEELEQSEKKEEIASMDTPHE